ncbi:MAG: hypothetical protein COB41_10850 [Proteobacteria bacterium]|nr:MAG: hypothetical protein COB41_10850 [Pseudomonadota bacterium]
MSWRWKIAGLLLFGLLCWELIVRFFVLSPAQEVFEPGLGYVHAPYANILRTYEGYARFQLDQFGLNNDALPDVLPNKRVFVVGDSFVEAYQVMRGENFVGRLAEIWQNSLLFNAGSSGAAPDTSLLAYNMLAPFVQPTHVLLCVNASDLYELLAAKEERHADGSLKALLRQADASASQFKAIKLWLYGHSALITHLKWKYENDIRAWLTGFDEKKDVRKKHELVGTGLQKAMERWQFVLQKFQKSGVKLTVLIMPELHYLPNKQVQQKVRQGRVVLANEAVKLGVPVLDSNAVFAQDFEQSGQPAIGFSNTHYGKGHINAYGHKLLAIWLDSQRYMVLR